MKINFRLLLLVLLVMLLSSMLLALMLGSVTMSPAALWRVLLGQDTGLSATIVWELRWPRALAALATGALLALAGALLQVLLRNPLADPYVLGTSGGAAVAVLASMLTGLTGLWLTGSAFAGALLSMLLVFGLARGSGSWTAMRLLLTGVVVAAGWGALISFLLAVSSDRELRGMLFWLMGDLSHSRVSWLVWLALLTGFGLSWLLARALNLLARGELAAAALGVDVRLLRKLIYFTASLLTAVAVTLAGSIGFVGLIVPHMIRLLAGGDHRLLLPCAMLLGGIFLLLADTLARTLWAPQQLPVGVVTALIGVPVFLWLLYRDAQRQTTAGDGAP